MGQLQYYMKYSSNILISYKIKFANSIELLFTNLDFIFSLKFTNLPTETVDSFQKTFFLVFRTTWSLKYADQYLL